MEKTMTKEKKSTVEGKRMDKAPQTKEKSASNNLEE